MNAFDLNGKKAIITGAGGYIGRAVTERFLASGASVALWDMRKPQDERSLLNLEVNVTDYQAVESAAAASNEALGGIDILINCAGIAGPNAPVDEYGLDAWDSVIRVNLYGTYYCGRAVVPFMRKGRYGRIVNFSSMAGKDGNPNACGYSAAKSGIIGLTKSMGKELAETGILVNAIAPAVIDSEMAHGASPEHFKYMVAKMPMARLGTVEEVAALVSWIASSECSFSTGAVYDISGGRADY